MKPSLRTRILDEPVPRHYRQMRNAEILQLAGMIEAGVLRPMPPPSVCQWIHNEVFIREEMFRDVVEGSGLQFDCTLQLRVRRDAV